jgi:hypothetical protein
MICNSENTGPIVFNKSVIREIVGPRFYRNSAQVRNIELIRMICISLFVLVLKRYFCAINQYIQTLYNNFFNMETQSNPSFSSSPSYVVRQYASLFIERFVEFLFFVTNCARETKVGIFWPQFYVHGFILSMLNYDHLTLISTIMINISTMYMAVYIRKYYIHKNVEDSHIRLFYMWFSLISSTILIFMLFGTSNVMLMFFTWNNIYTANGNMSLNNQIYISFLSWLVEITTEMCRSIEKTSNR